ncbi:MAG: sensor histidine kinase [Candidatus Accumulibacter sp.]|jgi:two-component system sensor histidine kinase AlgZ|nr:sensor histidine kinase [Accumulibacter sp.]
MASIKHYAAGHPLPDFRNFGVMLRIVLGVNLGALVAALAQSRDVGEWLERYVEMAAWAQPPLFTDLVLLWLFARAFRLLPARWGQAAVILLAALSAWWQFDFWQFMGLEDGGWRRGARAALLAALAAGGLLAYFGMRARTFSPALAEARLQALTARIRPHFLFNSLNAVLSLIRSEPRRAEAALEELADLFRALMRDHRDLVPLADEIALCRQYLDLEKLRLGDRLNVEWEIDAVPADVEVPPLVLQPLLENAVYHGIEPSSEPGTVRIGFARKGGELRVWLANPLTGGGQESRGNRMALANVRERLALYYDLEAHLETREETRPDGSREYHVSIVLPCRKPTP